MSLQLRKSPFKRNRQREEELGDVFNKTSSNLSSVLSLVLTLFFTPALLATSLFSTEILFMLINLSLCMGNLTNLFYRIYQNDIGKAELFITLSLILLFVLCAYMLFPSVGALSFISVLTFANQLAVSINLFFLFKNTLIPPILSFIKNSGKQVGVEIDDKCVSFKELSLVSDEAILNHLFIKHFGHGVGDHSDQSDLAKLNILLEILTDYINKYEAPLFGSLNNQQVISVIQNSITQMTTQGNATSGYEFVMKKLHFKQAKVGAYEKAKACFSKDTPPEWKEFNAYMKGVSELTYQAKPAFFRAQALSLLDDEIQRQSQKIERLDSCIPAV